MCVRRDWYKPYDLDVATDDYASLIHNIFDLLITNQDQEHPERRNIIFQSIFVLHQQAVNAKPYRWLMLELIGEGDKQDDAGNKAGLYITGFTDHDGNWYMFNNRPRRLIPVANVFRRRDDYTDLVNGYQSLRYVRVSKQTTLDAVEHVANYFVPRASADVGYVSRALAILSATFPEAIRFTVIGDFVQHNWEYGADLDYLADYVVKWRVISCALMISLQEHESWNSK